MDLPVRVDVIEGALFALTSPAAAKDERGVIAYSDVTQSPKLLLACRVLLLGPTRHGAHDEGCFSGTIIPD